MLAKNIQACIFDLDGVIVDTAKYHYKAWRRLANTLGFDFSEKQNELLKGVGRMDSLAIILRMGGVNIDQDKRVALAAKKNDWYLEFINEMDETEILPGVVPFLEELKKNAIKIALGSASKNAPRILEKVQLTSFFEVIIDGSKTTIGKPHPQVFLYGAKGLGVQPKNCIVFEDAPKGVEAALAAEMFCVGVGEKEALSKAHLVISGFEEFSIENFNQLV